MTTTLISIPNFEVFHQAQTVKLVEVIIVVSNYNIHRDGWNCYRRLLVYATTTDSTKSHLIFMNHRMSQLIIIC